MVPGILLCIPWTQWSIRWRQTSLRAPRQSNTGATGAIWWVMHVDSAWDCPQDCGSFHYYKIHKIPAACQFQPIPNLYMLYRVCRNSFLSLGCFAGRCWFKRICIFLHHSRSTSIPQTCLKVWLWNTWHARTWLNRVVPVFPTVMQDHQTPMQSNILHCV